MYYVLHSSMGHKIESHNVKGKAVSKEGDWKGEKGFF